LLTGLVHHWHLGEATGSRLDSIGTAHLTPIGEPVQVEGILGNAVQLSPTTADFLYVNSDPTLRLNGTDFTIAGWLMLDSVSPMPILGKWQSGSKEYLLQCDGSTLSIIVSSNGLAAFTLAGSVLVETGIWYFFAAWYDTVLDTLYISIDNGVPEEDLYVDGVFGANSDFCLGYEGVAENYFAGRLNSISIWKRLLTLAERNSLYNSGAGLAYPFS